MRIVLGFLRPDEGNIWNGRPPIGGRGDLGLYARGARALPADAGRGPARLLRIAVRRARYGAGTPTTGYPVPRIEEFADRKAETLSKGNQQKVQYIATILHDPDVILMDEPFSGLDPVNVALLKASS